MEAAPGRPGIYDLMHTPAYYTALYSLYSNELYTVIYIYYFVAILNTFLRKTVQKGFI